MRPICPKCSATIDGEYVNAASDLAKCPLCGQIYKASALAAASGRANDLRPPPDTRVEFVRGPGNTAVITIPRERFGIRDVIPLGFAAFWMGFLLVFTGVAAHATIVLVILSIPFWIIGLVMCVSLMRQLTERQMIELGETQMTIEKRTLLARENVRIPYSAIRSLGYEPYSPRIFENVRIRGRWSRIDAPTGRQLRTVDVPAVWHGQARTFFAEQLSEAEHEWLLRVIKEFILAKTGRRV